MNALLRLISSPPRRSFVWAAPLRAIAGFGFMAHGYAKLARGPDAFSDILHNLGLPFPDLLAWATIAVELIGGLAVLAGFLIPVAATPMIVVLLVAIVSVHLPNGFSSIKLLSVNETGAHFGQPGYETDLLYMACLVALVLGGPGPFAADALWRRRSKGAPIRDRSSTPEPASPVLRVARPSDNLEALVDFYRRGLGFEVLSEFEDHEGFDGVILGRSGWPYHLEFTRLRGHKAEGAPSPDHLLVFYLPDLAAWRSALDRMRQAGFSPVKSFNPYWGRSGETFEDPDGYRVVFQREAWGL